jgi:hypothetical protein
MGNTLSGLTPSQTFQGLIKVGDNTNVDGTAKVLSDGAGTDLPMEVSTAGVNLTGSPTVNSVAIANTNEVAAKQDTLVSGTNIKTINGTSVLGSGDIVTPSTPPSGVAGAIQFTDGSAFASDAANLFWDDANNRLGVGTNAPSATTHIKGSGTTAATTSLLVQNSAGADALTVKDDLTATFGGSVQANSFAFAAVSQLSLNCRVTTTNSSNPQFRLFSAEGTASQTVNPTTSFHDIRNFTPTSGSALYTAFEWSGTINQTGGANGITRGLYINPTVTAAADFRAIEVVAGNVLIGNAAANTAKLSIKGSGTTSATTSLLVQNSAGDSWLQVKDDGDITNGADGSTNLKFTISPTANKYFRLTRQGINVDFYAGSSGNSSIETSGNAPFLLKASSAALTLSNGGVRIASAYGTTNASAQLEVVSTTKGFLPPRMTTTEKNAISSPSSGLQVYDTTLNQMSYYNGSSWINL